jgi:hypothetical protein
VPTLWVRFGFNLEDYSVESSGLIDDGHHHGPLFHRWLPNGENDAIALNPSDPGADLKVWFERRGFVNKNGFIEFDHNRKEVDDTLVLRQAVLDAGPLRGLLRLDNMPESQLTALQESRTGDKEYLAIGKRIVNLIYEPVSAFINVLRTNGGQYWISEIPRWDSRYQSLGSYLRQSMQSQWSSDSGKSWTNLVPDQLRDEIIVEASRGYREYLTKDDWNQLRAISEGAYRPPLASFLLMSAHRLLDQGKTKEAIIDAVTALEIALGELLRNKLKGHPVLHDKIQPFWKLPLPAQMISVAAVLGISGEDLECAVECIEVRNDVVHEGCNPPNGLRTTVFKFLQIISALLPGPRFKFPHSEHSNRMGSGEEWETDAGAEPESHIVITAE